MISLNSIKEIIPYPIRLFLGKALLLFIVWQGTYGLFAESQLMDIPLTTHVGKASTWVLNNLTPLNDFSAVPEIFSESLNNKLIEQKSYAIYHNDEKVLHIAHSCNGLSLIALYIGFIICMPSTFLRKLKYILIGIILLDAVNIFRCAGLIYLSEYFYAYFDFAHHYLFKACVYGFTFLLWMKFSKKVDLKKYENIQVK